MNTNFGLTITKCRKHMLHDRIERIKFKGIVKILKFLLIFRFNICFV